MPTADADRPPPPRRWRRRLLLAAVGLLLAAVAAEAGRVFFGGNFHTVLPGRVYRCAQPSPRDLETAVRDHGIRTVVNLRGSCNPFPWYLDECRTTHHLGVCQEDVCLSAGRLPPVTEIRRLVEVLDRAEYPLLLHCRRGADRTGLASAIVLLLKTDASVPSAAAQLGPRYGHFAIGRTGSLDQFLGLYQEWLDAGGHTHSPALFRHWVNEEYCGGSLACAFERPPAADLELKAGVPAALTVRVRNTSVRPWRLSPQLVAGTHVGYHVWNDRDELVVNDKSGLFDAEVRPGAALTVTLPLPGLRPGRYRLLVDMVDERQCWFYQAGSEPLEEELTVRE
jgi:protein tyrosine phosphatase (PTP) superfamily phosphohydrolase (DUF442 family)